MRHNHQYLQVPVEPEVMMSKMDSLPLKTWKLSKIQTFVKTVLAKPAKSFFSKCDLELTFIYEVIQRGISSNILMRLYAGFIWL